MNLTNPELDKQVLIETDPLTKGFYMLVQYIPLIEEACGSKIKQFKIQTWDTEQGEHNEEKGTFCTANILAGKLDLYVHVQFFRPEGATIYEMYLTACSPRDKTQEDPIAFKPDEYLKNPLSLD